MDAIIKDNIGHIPVFLNIQEAVTCKNKGCKGRTYHYCTKCEVSYCISRNRNCFQEVHSRFDDNEE